MDGYSGIANWLWKKGWLEVLVSKIYSTLGLCVCQTETITELPKCMAVSASLKWHRILNGDICQIHDIFAICGCKYTSVCIPKRNLQMNSFCILQFNYCPYLWIYHSRLVNNKITRLQKKKFILWRISRYWMICHHTQKKLKSTCEIL